APALLGTRQGARTGVFAAALLFAAHIGYGGYILYYLPKPTPAPGATPPVVRLLQPMIDQAAKLDSDADRSAIFEQH
ncbi:hypothetical protein SB659_20520, partial [Arthrobacter sp. SIMBA_036]|uniref:hypothetical protein n=1 Tax=Arthrobacter sp. SIMBA_036 TaxID=3085778 RepID=UPI00397C7E9B